MNPGLIIAALLLPPLALYLAEGVGTRFWICLGLTCLGFLPGMVFALFIVLTRHRTRSSEAA